jgi:hypothetical protein
MHQASVSSLFVKLKFNVYSRLTELKTSTVRL